MKNGIVTYPESTAYYKNNKLHREDGPAIEWKNGNKHWLLNDRLHRTDGPAIDLVETELECTVKKWSINGKYHREDGPAVEFGNGYKEWWIDGEKITEAEFNQLPQNKQE